MKSQFLAIGYNEKNGTFVSTQLDYDKTILPTNTVIIDKILKQFKIPIDKILVVEIHIENKTLYPAVIKTIDT